jgi:hypothetical protein
MNFLDVVYCFYIRGNSNALKVKNKRNLQIDFNLLHI